MFHMKKGAIVAIHVFLYFFCLRERSMLPSTVAAMRVGEVDGTEPAEMEMEHSDGLLLEASPAEQATLDGLTSWIGEERLWRSMAKIEGSLRPVWRTLPREQQRNFSETVAATEATSALTRYFLQRHSWRFDAGLPTAAMRAHVPSSIGNYFNVSFERGFTFVELCMYVAVVEHYVHLSSMTLLRSAYAMLKLPVSAKLDFAHLERLVRAYTALHVVNLELLRSRMNEARIERSYPAWKQTKSWVSSALQSTMRARGCEAQAEAASKEKRFFDFAAVADIVEEVQTQMDEHQNEQCVDMRSLLLQAEENSSGRIKTEDFYRLMADSQFLPEELAALRRHGVLDETAGAEPRVIVLNYVQSDLNCLSGATVYRFCCKNSCDGIRSRLEEEVETPMARPEQIASVLRNYSATVMQGTRSLPPEIEESIADWEQSGQLVPLHGRLVARWLHGSFPRDCPHPQLRFAPAKAEEGEAEPLLSDDDERSAISPSPKQGARADVVATVGGVADARVGDGVATSSVTSASGSGGATAASGSAGAEKDDEVLLPEELYWLHPETSAELRRDALQFLTLLCVISSLIDLFMRLNGVELCDHDPFQGTFFAVSL
eukprot:TRINITY_DN1154_c2_g1_i1.p1 TRINITY_DN1154_c2_g1~~TRINITY_DN1154_c2_g1_i1.p1  ORF type:complete len:603 (+),score=160.75 TRINITY_DN1154_c2_g1_i1:62-1870(+)